MDAGLNAPLALAALVVSLVALFFSLVAAFPGLKVVLAAIRDGVLWLALVVVLGGVGVLLWQDRQALRSAAGTRAAAADAELPARPSGMRAPADRPRELTGKPFATSGLHPTVQPLVSPPDRP